MRKARRTPLLAGAAVAALLGATDASASPQGTADLTIGVAGVGENRTFWNKTDFHLGFRGDLLFGQTRSTDFAIGPYAEIGTFGFNDLQFGGGVSGLLPVLDPFPIVVSLGAYGRAAHGAGVEPGVTGQIFWGSRSFNYNSSYVMTGGLLTELRLGLGATKETSILIGAQVDLEAIALPFIFLYEAVSGGSSEAASIPPATSR